MSKLSLATLFALGTLTLAGCAGKPENPVDHFTYRDEPLVKQVEKGMTKERVLAIGGPASSSVKRTYRPGTCNNYILTTDGHQQPFHVSFDANGLVDHTGFMTCAQREERERELHP
ncbi:osmotically-inducible lipoprotein OsmE [Pseudomonas mangiferae]|uniref:Osmotically-inducible lipoprotein OsmE n=1 Tax=Pseudomonas mangiferae TaxID=2593654 RepID=A0A553GWU5_9PSED|nr:osmotically-inducible lipoprotein OsmE [Pseudomonas mangiferae]TRX73972.1 osmotically-inducible lipoprotein OsmE [Pseudomonas mangiferae]